jgi:hypothetical protein
LIGAEIQGQLALVSAVFNFRRQYQVVSMCCMALMVLIIVLMMGFSLLLSNSVSAIVLQPLENLLTGVKEMASQIFKSVTSMAAAGSTKDTVDDDDDDEDIEGLIPIKKPDKPADPLSEIDQAVVVQELHSGQHEGVNGNFTHDGAFKEWHEVVSKPTIHGDLLYILPYSVID